MAFLKYLIWAIVAVIGLLVIVGLFAPAPKKNNVDGTSITSAPEAASSDDKPSMPANEAAFIAQVNQSAKEFREAKNEMAAGGVRAKRKDALCELMKSKQIKNWVGTIKSLSTNSDGRGVLSITIADNITLSTTNNIISDGLNPMETLIDPKSTVFDNASQMAQGHIVSFSGKFAKNSTDCVQETSMTMEGSMKEPEFLFKFDSVNALQTSQPGFTNP